MGRITGMSNGVAHADGSVSVTIEIDGAPSRLTLTPDDAGALVTEVCALIAHAAHPSGSELPQTAHGPVAALGMGLRQMDDPDTAGLVVNLPGFALVFETPRTSMAELGRAALAMSAGGRST